MKTAQAAAAQVVARVLSGRTLDTAFAAMAKAAASSAVTLDAHDRALAHELCYGTLRHLGQLRDVLKPLLKRPVTDPELEALLMVTLYQLQHGSASSHAVVSHAVDAAVALRLTSAKGLVNAVLRNYLRHRDAIDRAPPSSDEARYSYPQWWIDAVRAAYPVQWKDVLEEGNVHPPLTLRANRRRITRQAALADLRGQGIGCRAIGVDGIILDTPRNVAELPGFAEGRLSVQDHGAQLAAPLLEVEDGMRVLDACAAPGGKTTHILEMSDCTLLALERDERRLQKVRDNLDRLGLTAETRAADVTDVASWWDGVPFDRILTDVPCTASGVIRRHPDGKWLRRPTDIVQFADQQQQIIEAAWSVLRPGGKLLYTTCSVFESENEGLVRAFVARHSESKRCALRWPDGLTAAGDGQLLPVSAAAGENHDGFFYALLEKRGG